ncbi:hypothetical protein BDZ89DRAFT_993973 [Hymenopellis radicata]|nr:hypothetical protein BDZ89DRAFT_993973 [Hymenopellis radicata]
MSSLRTHLLVAAQRFTATVHQSGGVSILMGGAAASLLGGSRESKDLDFNLPVMSRRVYDALNSSGIHTIMADSTRPDRFSANVPASSPGARDAVSVDLAVIPHTSAILRFTKQINGIVVADERLLFLDKIRCFTERGAGQDKKVTDDVTDIMFCLDVLVVDLLPIPQDLVRLIIPDDSVWEKFWVKLESGKFKFEYNLCADFFGQLGLPLPEKKR